MKHTLVFHIIALGKKLQKVIGFKAPPLSLTYSQATAILVIDSDEMVTQKEIAARLHLEPGSVVALVDELEKTGIANRQSQGNDRRKYQVVLTQKGKKTAELIKSQTKRLENFLKSKISPNKSESFFNTIDTISQELETWKLSNQKTRKEVKNENFSSKRSLAV